MRDRLSCLFVVALVISFILASQPVVVHGQSSQSGTDDSNSGGTLIDVIIDALQGFIQTVGDKLLNPIKTANQALGTIVDTPYPDSVFDRPTNGSWPNIYDFYWETMIPLSLLVWGLAVGIVILLEATGHLFSGYHTAKLKRRAFIGLLGVFAWWWLAALSLRFMSALTDVIMPTIGDSMFEVISASVMGVIIYAITVAVDFVLVALLAIIYLGRHLAIYGFVLIMPLLIVLWVPGLGPFRPLAQLSAKLGQFYVPFLIMTLPTAILFRVGELLGQSLGLTLPKFFAWIAGLLVPFFAVIVPLVLFWQAGLLFVLGSRFSRHMSAERATKRTRAHVQVTRQGGRNAIRALRDKPPVRGDGQVLLDGGGSRTYRAGRGLRRTGVRSGAVARTAGDRLQTTVTRFRERIHHDGETDADTRHPKHTDTSESRWSGRGDWSDPSRAFTSSDRNEWAAGDEGPQWGDRGDWNQRESRSFDRRDPWRRDRGRSGGSPPRNHRSRSGSDEASDGDGDGASDDGTSTGGDSR